jgi:proteasome lid subunit RPN8/RPN11
VITIHIPHEVVDEAVLDLHSEGPEEAIGFFAAQKVHRQGEGESTYRVVWRKMTNVAGDRRRQSRISAEDMAVMILDDSLAPIAMLHSHPSGDPMPSQEDREEFPHHYVDNAFVWTHKYPDQLTQYYPGTRAFKLMPRNQVFLTVQW